MQDHSIKQLLRRLIKNASIYGLGTLLAKAGNFVLLPFYWKKLSPAEFGVIGVCQIVTLFLAPVLELGLSNTVQRLYLEWKENERPLYLGALLSISLAWSVLTCGALQLAGRGFFKIFFESVEFHPNLEITLWTAFFLNLSMIPFGLMRIREEMKRFTTFNFLAFAAQAAFALYFLYGLDWGVRGYLLAGLLSAALTGVWLSVSALREAKLGFGWSHVRDPMKYGLPTLPAALIEGGGSVLDRYFLDKTASLSSIGFYTVARQFGLVYNVFAQILKASWIPFTYRLVAERTDSAKVFARLSVVYYALLVAGSLGVAAFAPDLLIMLRNPSYLPARELIPWVVLGFFVNSVGQGLGRGLDLSMRTGFMAFAPAVGLILTWFGCVSLIPRYGVAGAIAVFVGVQLARTVIELVFGALFYPRPSYWPQFLGMTAIGAAAYAICARLPTEHSLAASLALKTLVVTASFAGLFGILLRMQGRNDPWAAIQVFLAGKAKSSMRGRSSKTPARPD